MELMMSGRMKYTLLSY